MKILFIVNESPYGSEKAWNALRLATAMLQEVEGAQVQLFLLSDGVYCALTEHHRPDGSTNIAQMLSTLIEKGAEVLACVTCVDQRGLWATRLLDGVQLGSMVDLAKWTAEADRVLVF